jgi:hypothetical protein
LNRRGTTSARRETKSTRRETKSTRRETKSTRRGTKSTKRETKSTKRETQSRLEETQSRLEETQSRLEETQSRLEITSLPVTSPEAFRTQQVPSISKNILKIPIGFPQSILSIPKVIPLLPQPKFLPLQTKLPISPSKIFPIYLSANKSPREEHRRVKLIIFHQTPNARL